MKAGSSSGRMPIANGHPSKDDQYSVATYIMPPLRKKGRLLTAYLEYLLTSEGSVDGATRSIELTILSPANVEERGSTLAVLFRYPPRSPDYQEQIDQTTYSAALNKVITHLKANKIPVDTRAPDLVRLSPAPLYNTFEEVRRMAMILRDGLK